jgi:hypothetical protein
MNIETFTSADNGETVYRIEAPYHVEVLPESAEPTVTYLSPQTKLVRLLNQWLGDHDASLGGASLLEIDTNGDDVVIRLEGFTFDNEGEIVPNEREYNVTATVTLEVEVTGVTATSEDDALEQALDTLRNSDYYASSFADIDVHLSDVCIDDVDER